MGAVLCAVRFLCPTFDNRWRFLPPHTGSGAIQADERGGRNDIEYSVASALSMSPRTNVRGLHTLLLLNNRSPCIHIRHRWLKSPIRCALRLKAWHIYERISETSDTQASLQSLNSWCTIEPKSKTSINSPRRFKKLCRPMSMPVIPVASNSSSFRALKTLPLTHVPVLSRATLFAAFFSR